MAIISTIFKRDLCIAWQSRTRLAQSLSFYLLVLTVFPLTLQLTPSQLRDIAPGLFWVAAMLSLFINFSSLFAQDYDDGALEHWLSALDSPLLYVVSKIIGHWFAYGLPLLLITPVLGMMYQLHSLWWAYCG